jgi:hypothetical protein
MVMGGITTKKRIGRRPKSRGKLSFVTFSGLFAIMNPKLSILSRIMKFQQDKTGTFRGSLILCRIQTEESSIEGIVCLYD